MQSLIILLTFLLGVALCGVSVFGFFTASKPSGSQRHEGELSIAGVTLRGTSGPVLFLLIGAVLVLAGFGWASTEREKIGVEKELAVVEQDARRLDAEVTRMVDVNRTLTNALPREVFIRLEKDQPELLNLAPHRLRQSLHPATPVRPSN